MNEQLQALLAELERFGDENDAQVANRQDRMLNITRDTGEFLALLVAALRAHEILEIGTSNGYSTLWLAESVRQLGGRVTTLERLPHKAELAQQNFARAGLESWIQVLIREAGDYLAAQAGDSFSLIFLDAERANYDSWWPDLQRLLRPGGLLVVDNAVSHAGQITGFVARVRETPGYMTSLVPIGKGEFLILKEMDRRNE